MTVIDEMKKEFENTKKDLGFSSTIDEIEDLFQLEDYIQECGYVSNKFSRQMGHRMIDYLSKWNEFLHRILMPNPNSIVIIEESKAFSPEDRKEMRILFHKVMELISRNSVINMKKDKVEEAKWIDECVTFVRDELIVKLIPKIENINEVWKKDTENEKKQTSPSYSG